MFYSIYIFIDVIVYYTKDTWYLIITKNYKMTLKEQFVKEQESKFNGTELLFETSNQKYIEWMESKLNTEDDFYTELMRLVNTHVSKGLSKPDLVSKMEYATRSCILS